jgi:hypothetical protein
VSDNESGRIRFESLRACSFIGRRRFHHFFSESDEFVVVGPRRKVAALTAEVLHRKVAEDVAQIVAFVPPSNGVRIDLQRLLALRCATGGRMLMG